MEEGYLILQGNEIIANPNNKLGFKIEKEVQFKDTMFL